MSAIDLPADLDSARAARRFAECFVGMTHAPVDLADLELLLSELVANAVVHASSPVRIRLTDFEGAMLVEVSNAGAVAGGLEPTLPPPTAEGGRGLYLVERLAHRWGVDSSRRGTTVWFQLDCA